MVVAKFKCTGIVESPSASPVVVGSEPGVSKGVKYSERVKLEAVYSADPDHPNKVWTQWTPFGVLEMQIDNPGAFGKFEVGKECLLTFAPAAD